MQRVAGLLAVLVVGAGAVLGTVSYLGGEPASVAFEDVKRPPMIVVGEETQLQFSIENKNVDPITITAISLDTSLLKGVDVVGVEVNGRALSERAGEKRDDLMAAERMQYKVEREVPDGELMTVTVMIRGVTPGRYKGDVSVWVESDILGVVPYSRAARTGITFTVQ